MKTVFVALLAGIAACAFALPNSQAHAAKSKDNLVYSFCTKANCADGARPYASLIDVKGTLYGTTSIGGVYDMGAGTVFAIDLATGKEKVVYSFCKQLDGTDCLDGAIPRAELMEAKGILYGTTQQGGSVGTGTVFSIDPKNGAETVLHDFAAAGDGVFPGAGVISVKGILYGVTLDGGGSCDCGIVFSLDPNTGAESVLHAFAGGKIDGSGPVAGLTFLKGKLYGTTRFGGAFDFGTIFSVDVKTGQEKVLYSFCTESGCPDGGDPETRLIEVNGMLYGTTDAGGSETFCTNPDNPPGCGTVFSFDPKTGTETVLHTFCNQQSCTDGAFPEGNLINLNGKLYGTTYRGGKPEGCEIIPGCGTVFSVDLKTGAHELLYSFASGTGADGIQPVAGLVAVNGTLYGTTLFGGPNNDGVVFALKQKH